MCEAGRTRTWGGKGRPGLGAGYRAVTRGEQAGISALCPSLGLGAAEASVWLYGRVRAWEGQGLRPVQCGGLTAAWPCPALPTPTRQRIKGL